MGEDEQNLRIVQGDGDAASGKGGGNRASLGERLAAAWRWVSRSQVLWPMAFVTFMLGLIVSILIGFVIIRRNLVSGAQTVERIAQAFRTGSVQTSFISYATDVSGSAYLQFATLDQMELLERRDSTSVLWGRLRLPEVVVEARIPVHYTYYLDLEDEWTLRLDDTTVEVVAPGVRANRPAVDASAIEYVVQADSVLRNEDAVMEQLRREITPRLAARAGENIGLVREEGRRRTAEFVRAFLLWRFGEDVDAYRIEVRFRDEVALPPLPRPAIESPDESPGLPPSGTAPGAAGREPDRGP